jgi:hypothetical protein
VIVAEAAGDWCASGEILGYEGADDVALEAVFVIDDVIRDG